MTFPCAALDGMGLLASWRRAGRKPNVTISGTRGQFDPNSAEHLSAWLSGLRKVEVVNAWLLRSSLVVAFES